MAGDVQAVCVLEEEACWLQLEDFRMLLIKTIDPSCITPYLRQCQVISPEDEEQIFHDPMLVIRRRKVGDVQAVCVREEEACWLQLEDFRMLLIKTIDPSRITPYLRQCQVISPEDEEQIFNDPMLVIRRRKVGTLLDILQRSGFKGYTAFLESLELDYPQLYSRITGKEPNRTFSILVDTAGDRGLTEFLMSEVSNLQRALQEEKRKRQAACSMAKDQEESTRQQQLRDRELRKLSERVQKVREERDRLTDEVKQLREHNYILMTNINALSDDKNSALLANRDLQLEIEKLKHSLMSAESANRLARHRTVTLRSAMEQRPSQEALLSLQRHNVLLSERVKELESRKLSTSQHNGAKEEEEEKKEEEVKKEEEKKEEEKKEERQLDLLSTVFKLRRELHQAEEERNRTHDKMEELVLRYSRLKGDAKMYRQRNEQTLRQLEEVSKERDKAMSSRADLHAESSVYLQEKDQYREQVRQLTERSDWQQLQLLRSKGEVLQLQTRVRRLTCSTHQSGRSQSASSEEAERTEGRAKGSSDDIPSGTSGENEEAAALQCHQSPLDGTTESGQQPSTDAAWEDELSDCWRPRSRCHRNFFYRRKRALRSKVIGKEHAPCNLDDSSGSDITDSDGI